MKQKYQKPTMRAIELQQRPTLLEGSGLTATRDAYNHSRTDGSSSTADEVWQ